MESEPESSLFICRHLVYRIVSYKKFYNGFDTIEFLAQHYLVKNGHSRDPNNVTKIKIL